MDWRAYFTLADFSLEKANPHHKPKGPGGGQFDRKNGWDIKGYSHAGVQPTAAYKRLDFNSAPGAVQDRTVKMAVISVMRRGSMRGGAAGGAMTSASEIAAVVSQATGSLYNRDLAINVANTMSRLQERGEIKMTTTTMRLAREGGFWVYKDPGTGKQILNPMTGKPTAGGAISGAKEVATRDVHAFTLTEKGKSSLGRAEQQGFELKQSTSISRPTKFDAVKGSLAEQALSIRKETFPNSQLAPQGRVHSNEKSAPEMLTGAELEKKYPKLAWYDATSSARANVGAMTGNQELLDAVRLSKKNPTTPAMKTAKNLGLHEPDKPYYALLNPSNGKGIEITKDMVNIGKLASNPDGIKKVVKTVDTPRLYGAKANGTVKGATNEILKQAGFDKTNPATMADKVKAKTLATHLVNNFQQTPIAQFEEKFKGMAKEMPDNFVYTNPVSGFRMTFQKHEMNHYRPNLKDDKGNSVKISMSFPGNPSVLKSRNSAMPLFVQSFDAAVKDIVTTKLKNPYTKHDAFAVPKAPSSKEGAPLKVKELKATVAKAYESINKANPIGDLATQMKSQWQKQIGQSVRAGGTTKNPTYKTFTKEDYAKKVASIDSAVKAFFPTGKPSTISIPSDTGHLELE